MSWTTAIQIILFWIFFVIGAAVLIEQTKKG